LSKKYPPLYPKQICKILVSLGFRHTKNQGDHRYYEDDEGYIVQVDMGDKRGFCPDAIQFFLQQSGVTREKFYGATKATAKKIGIKYQKSKCP